MSEILRAASYFDMMGLVPIWFTKAFVHVNGCLANLSRDKAVLDYFNFLCLSNYLCICEHLHEVWARELNIYTDDLLSDLDMKDVTCGAAAFFSKISLGVGVRVQGLLSFTLTELQTIALALKCVLLSCSVMLHSNNQAALDACVLECELSYPDFQNRC
ncbi:hypothetical protein G9A89_004550 [Geosiphon pyriformis]|nr:hypothetical protein G9A89_004550 [Geosiphon pyriformis]